MVPGEYVEALERLFAALNHGVFDDRAIAALRELDDELEVLDYPGFPESAWRHGHDGAVKWIVNIWKIASDVRFTTAELIDGVQDRFVAVVHVNATGKLSGLGFEVVSPTVFTVRDGRFCRIEPFEDLESAIVAAREGQRPSADPT